MTPGRACQTGNTWLRPLNSRCRLARHVCLKVESSLVNLTSGKPNMQCHPVHVQQSEFLVRSCQASTARQVCIVAIESAISVEDSSSSLDLSYYHMSKRKVLKDTGSLGMQDCLPEVFLRTVC